MPNVQEILLMLAACLVSAVLGAVGGWTSRGDCTVQAKSTAATSTAKAETKAAKIETKAEVKNEKVRVVYKYIHDQVAALPPEPPPAPGCPARALDSDELRLWNSGADGIDIGVQQPGVDEKVGGPPAPAKPVRP